MMDKEELFDELISTFEEVFYDEYQRDLENYSEEELQWARKDGFEGAFECFRNWIWENPVNTEEDDIQERTEDLFESEPALKQWCESSWNRLEDYRIKEVKDDMFHDLENVFEDDFYPNYQWDITHSTNSITEEDYREGGFELAYSCFTDWVTEQIYNNSSPEDADIALDLLKYDELLKESCQYIWDKLEAKRIEEEDED